MLVQVTETYRPRKFRKSVLLHCKNCDKRLRRIFSDYYTRNPWNTKTDAECQRNCYARIEKDIAEARDKGVLCRQCEQKDK